MGSSEKTELNAKLQPALYTKGQEMGLQGAPIPPNVVNTFIAYLDIHGRFAELSPVEKKEYEIAAAMASSLIDDRGDAPVTEMQAAFDAATIFAGYVDGVLNYLTKNGKDGLPRALTEDLVKLHPQLIQGSKEGAIAYVRGHGSKKPAHLEEGRALGRDVSILDAHALGFIVRAATLETRVERDEIPVTERDWKAFESGMTRGNQAFSQLVREVAGDSVLFQRLVDMNALGIRVDMAIQRTASGTNTA